MQRGSLQHSHESLARAAARLLGASVRLLVRLLRREDDLLQAIALLVSTLALHFRHRLLHVRKPSVRHFYLTRKKRLRCAR